MREHLSQCASPPFRNELHNVNKQFADRLRANTTKTIHFGCLHLHDLILGRYKSGPDPGRQVPDPGPPRLGHKMAFYAPLQYRGLDTLNVKIRPLFPIL